MLIAGKTIAVSLANFWAEVSIVASARLRLVPHPLNDPNEFGSLADLHGISRKEGYQGGLILLQVCGPPNPSLALARLLASPRLLLPSCRRRRVVTFTGARPRTRVSARSSSA